MGTAITLPLRRTSSKLLTIHMKSGNPIPLPRIVSEAEWQAACAELLAKEKAATRARDALAAERRRQPMYRIEKNYVFAGPRGPARVPALLEGGRQLRR